MLSTVHAGDELGWRLNPAVFVGVGNHLVIALGRRNLRARNELVGRANGTGLLRRLNGQSCQAKN
jgi:hypothetical protein